MNDIAIKVENLSKLHKIGDSQQGYKTLSMQVVFAVVERRGSLVICGSFEEGQQVRQLREMSRPVPLPFLRRTTQWLHFRDDLGRGPRAKRGF